MKVAVPKETAPGERRVALVPEIVSKLTASGSTSASSGRRRDDRVLQDDAFREAGAEVGDPWSAEVVAKVRKPSSGKRTGLVKGASSDRLPGAVERP